MKLQTVFFTNEEQKNSRNQAPSCILLDTVFDLPNSSSSFNTDKLGVKFIIGGSRSLYALPAFSILKTVYCYSIHSVL